MTDEAKPHPETEDAHPEQDTEGAHPDYEDENCYGLLLSFHDIEDEEYASSEVAPFVERFLEFERLCAAALEEMLPQGSGVAVSSLGHCVYAEFPDDELRGSPIAWAKSVRSKLTEGEFNTAAILTHGGRWRAREGNTGVTDGRRWSLPSEALRKALFAETATHGVPSEEDAWGAGLYVDTEVIEALKLKPKNQPTVLEIAGSGFFRLSR